MLPPEQPRTPRYRQRLKSRISSQKEEHSKGPATVITIALLRRGTGGCRVGPGWGQREWVPSRRGRAIGPNI